MLSTQTTAGSVRLVCHVWGYVADAYTQGTDEDKSLALVKLPGKEAVVAVDAGVALRSGQLGQGGDDFAVGKLAGNGLCHG